MTVTVTNGYCTAADLATYMTVSAASYANDLASAINTASREIDGWTARRFYADDSATARVYWSKDESVAIIDDAWQISSVKLSSNDDGTYDKTYTSGVDFTAEPLNGVADGISGLPTYRLRWSTPVLPLETRLPSLQVTAKWGWATVPEPVRQACLIIAGEIFKLREAPFGVAGFGEMGAVRIGRMSPQAVQLLHPYRFGNSMLGIA
jgi:hypothetical protein